MARRRTPAGMVDAFTEIATTILRDKRITAVRYMRDSEMDLQGWSQRPLVIILDDGTLFYAVSDAEGNNAGSLFVTAGSACGPDAPPGQKLTLPAMC